jgi:uncharacterized membrane protein YkvA (DUF1232 family)
MAKKRTSRAKTSKPDASGKKKTRPKTKPKAQKKARSEERLRTVLEMIGPEFIEDGARRMTRGDIEEVSHEITQIEKKLRKSATFDRFRKDWPFLVSLVRDHCEGVYRDGTYWSVAVSAFALRYVIKPIDIIPDSLPVVGELDDALVLSHALLMVRSELQAYRVWKLARSL